MHRKRYRRAGRLARLLLAIFLTAAARPAIAHEGHAALPTKGATVQGDQLLLSSGAAKAIGLTLAKVELKDLSDHVTVNAHVELPWHQEVVVTSLVGGRIEELLVKPGVRVRRDQELLRLSSAELEKLQLDLLQAQAELRLAERVLKQKGELAQEGAVAGKAAEEAEAQYRQKRAEFAIARAKLAALNVAPEQLEDLQEGGKRIRFLSIRAPRDGSIVHSDVRMGQVIEPSQHLFEIVDGARLWIVGNVLEADASLVQAGQRVTATFDAVEETVIEGEIEGVDVHLDSENRTLPVHLTVENRDGLLQPGITGRMKVEIRRVEKAVVVPSNALIQEAQQTYVLVQEGPGKFRKRKVQVGLALADEVEILDGLFPGNRVVQTGKVVLASLFGRTTTAKDKEQNADSSKGRAKFASMLVQGVAELPTSAKAFANSTVDGRLAKIHVDHGQSVSAGDILAEIESLEVRNLQLQLLKVRTTLETTRAQLRRLQKAGANTVAQKEVWRLESEKLQLENEASSLARQLVLAGISEDQITKLREGNLDAIDELLASVVAIRAPIDGRVARFELNPGQVVKRDERIFEVQNLSTMWVRGSLFEKDAARVKVGDKAEVTLPGKSAFRSTATVARVSPIVGTKERTVSIWVELNNSQQELKEEMSAWLTIQPKVGEAARRERTKQVSSSTASGN